jgi:hypothetical protein
VDRNLVSLKEVSQDGVKIKASAAKQSMRRKKTLIGKALELKKHINKLERQCQTHALEKAVEKKKKREIEESKSKMKRIIQAANEINRHKKQLNENRINNGKKKLSNKVVSEIRGSTTDPECRKMRMSDHSVQCAYNFQIAVETDSELVLKTTPIQSSSDTGTMKPMFEDLKRKYPIKISRFLVDSAYIKLGDLNFLHDQNCLVYSPTSKSTALTIKKRVFSGKKNVSEGEKEFIFRMKTNESKQIYNKRIRTSETINAFIRNRRLYQFTVRGLQKVKGFIDLIALTYNMQVIKRMFPNFLTGTS